MRARFTQVLFSKWGTAEHEEFLEEGGGGF